MTDKLVRLKDKAASDKRLLEHLSPQARIRDQRMRAAQSEDKLRRIITDILKEKRHLLAVDIARLKALSPLDKLQSGFS